VSQEIVPDGRWLSVWGVDERVYFVQDDFPDAIGERFEYWRQGHCSVTLGAPVLYAGELFIENGFIAYTTPESGQ